MILKIMKLVQVQIPPLNKCYSITSISGGVRLFLVCFCFQSVFVLFCFLLFRFFFSGSVLFCFEKSVWLCSAPFCLFRFQLVCIVFKSLFCFVFEICSVLFCFVQFGFVLFSISLFLFCFQLVLFCFASCFICFLRFVSFFVMLVATEASDSHSKLTVTRIGVSNWV